MLGAKGLGSSLKPKKKSLFNQIGEEKIIEKSFYGNLNDYTKLNSKISQVKPNIIFHLAAQPLVLESYKNALNTHNTNIMAKVNLLVTCRRINSIQNNVIITTEKVYKIKNKKNIISAKEKGERDDWYSD